MWAYLSDAHASERRAGCLVQGSSVAAGYHVCTAQSMLSPEFLDLLQVERSREKRMTPSREFHFPKYRNRVCSCLLAGSLLLRQVVLRLCHHLEALFLGDGQGEGGPSRVSDSVGLRWGLIVCVSNKLVWWYWSPGTTF